MNITNIKWDIDMDVILSEIEEMTVEKASKALSLPGLIYGNMNTAERIDFTYGVFEHNPEGKAELIGLPSEVDVPDDVEDIADYLSDEYEFCVLSFEGGNNMKVCFNSKEEIQKKVDELTPFERDVIYRYLWGQHVREDVEGRAEELEVELDEGTIDVIVERYVEQGDYDCNLCYWDNIDNLIWEESGKEETI